MGGTIWWPSGWCKGVDEAGSGKGTWIDHLVMIQRERGEVMGEGRGEGRKEGEMKSDEKVESDEEVRSDEEMESGEVM